MTQRALSPRRAKLLERFCVRGLAAINVATDACEAGDCTTLRRQLHAIKGDARMLALEPLADHLEHIQGEASGCTDTAQCSRIRAELGHIAAMLSTPLEVGQPASERLAQVCAQLRPAQSRPRPSAVQGCELGLVMVVDDSPVVRMMLAASLRARGAEVLAFANVQETLEAVAKRRPRVILSDVEMPGEGGLSLLQRIQERDDAPPVVLLSGGMEAGERRRAQEMGAAGVFSKSSDMSGVIDHVLGLF